jgi:hypothetical protein
MAEFFRTSTKYDEEFSSDGEPDTAEYFAVPDIVDGFVRDMRQKGDELVSNLERYSNGDVDALMPYVSHEQYRDAKMAKEADREYFDDEEEEYFYLGEKPKAGHLPPHKAGHLAPHKAGHLGPHKGPHKAVHHVSVQETKDLLNALRSGKPLNAEQERNAIVIVGHSLAGKLSHEGLHAGHHGLHSGHRGLHPASKKQGLGKALAPKRRN